jgi:D-alanine-D-alanine ligase
MAADILSNGCARVFVAWIAGPRPLTERLGAVAYSSASPALLEPFDNAPETMEQMAATVDTAAGALGLADWALFELQVDEKGQTAVISVDLLPSLEESSPMFASLSARGLSIAEVATRVIDAAKGRLRIAEKAPSRLESRPIRVGLVFNIKRIKPGYGGKNDEEAEFDSPTTIEAIAAAIRLQGHEVVLLEATPELASAIRPGFVDVVFNIAEGLRGRSRESQVPALLELCDIPYTGSDPATMLLALDKGLAKRIVRQAGIPTPNWFVMRNGNDRIEGDFHYPVVVKPIAEGSSKGVLAKGVAENEIELREAVAAIGERYPEGVIVEEFLPGREFTVALLGEHEVRILPAMEIIFRADLHNPIYTFDRKLDFSDEVRYEVPANVDGELLRQIEEVAKGAFVALRCRDIARIDLRVDRYGVVNFIECNPLPGLAPKWSDLCMMTQAIGMDYNTLIAEILAPAVQRFRAKQAASYQAQKGTK